MYDTRGELRYISDYVIVMPHKVYLIIWLFKNEPTCPSCCTTMDYSVLSYN